MIDIVAGPAVAIAIFSAIKPHELGGARDVLMSARSCDALRRANDWRTLGWPHRIDPQLLSECMPPGWRKRSQDPVREQGGENR
jgi:hypothetical protein